jgi:hypothetical protein
MSWSVCDLQFVIHVSQSHLTRDLINSMSVIGRYEASGLGIHRSGCGGRVGSCVHCMHCVLLSRQATIETREAEASQRADDIRFENPQNLVPGHTASTCCS